MVADEDIWYAAIKSRDARFDGRFFTGVKTTGIYCRPICPARTPLRKNVTFFACAAAAEEAGFRPCRRCRPESAPGSPGWLGVSTTVARALRLIEGGALDDGDVDTLAGQLGVGDRYLRRLFAKHVGTTPVAVAVSRRAHFARVLLDATPAPISEIALASGFSSVRRFNEVMRGIFDRTPTALRKRGAAGEGAGEGTVLRLSYRPPLDWRAMLAFLGARAIPGVEEVDGVVYRRTLFGGGSIEVRPARDGKAVLSARVRGVETARLLDVVRRVRRMFDLDADPLAIGAALGKSPRLARSVRAHPGLRVPGAWDGFETLARAVIGQQVSVAAARTLAGRLALRFGTPVAGRGEGGLTHVFPTAEALAGADPRTIGLPGARARSLSAIAGAVARDPALLGPAPSLAALVQRLCELPGVGPWTAHYAAMRVWGEPDAFPSGDLVLRRAAGDVTPGRLEQLSDAWRPWRAYAALHLWHMSSEEAVHEHRALAS